MTAIRIDSDNNNERGDLFTKLLEAYFLTLGYGDCIFDVGKAGREIDVQARHLTENRLLRAECKATKAKAGGAQLNKFAGALQVERKQRESKEVAGYFVSLSGFTGSALEQEDDASRGIICVDAEGVARQLIVGRVLVSLEAAVAAAAALRDVDSLELTSSPEIAATRAGWMWLIYFGDGHSKSHVVPIHGDGAVATEAIARTLGSSITAELDVVTRPVDNETALNAVRVRYFDYLARECGHVSFEGLPADEGLGARQLELEDIYTPLSLRRLEPAVAAELSHPSPDSDDGGPVVDVDDDGASRQSGRISLGELLHSHQRTAILGPPGAGKSTILKRLAVGYAFPDRRVLRGEALPDLEVFPLFLRCRQVDGIGRTPILETLKSIASHSELAADAATFGELAQEAVRSGTALLLIDGLDEIANEQSRAQFGQQLRIFMATYPGVRVVVSSREPGFRIVAGAIAGVCVPFQVAPLDRDAVRSLALSWYVQAVEETEELRNSVERLVNEIYESEQVRPIATNPLLLTTLLLVRRWVGEVPRKRTVLYDRAIDVLLMTWNVEGHEPLDPEETIPQLAFVAYRMMEEGIQSVSASRLAEFLVAARNAMPHVLGFVKISPADFVRRVEERSSLLSYSGHTEESGRVVPLYEFKHLSFQEYLAASAIARGFAKGDAGNSAAEVVSSLATLPNWQEALSMATVLSGMRASEIVAALLSSLEELTSDAQIRDTSPSSRARNVGEPASLLFALIVASLADEAKLSPTLARDVCGALIHYWGWSNPYVPSELGGVHASKFSDLFDETLKAHWASSSSHVSIHRVGAVWAEWAHAAISNRLTTYGPDDVVEYILTMLASEDPGSRAHGGFSAMTWAYGNELFVGGPIEYDKPELDGSNEQVERVADALLGLLVTRDPKMVYPASWGLAWVFRLRIAPDADAERAFQLLVPSWTDVLRGPLRRYPAWAFLGLPALGDFGYAEASADQSMTEKLERYSRKLPRDPRSAEGDIALASLVAAYYFGAEWARAALADQLPTRHQRIARPTAEVLAVELGVKLEDDDGVIAVRSRRRRTRRR